MNLQPIHSVTDKQPITGWVGRFWMAIRSHHVQSAEWNPEKNGCFNSLQFPQLLLYNCAFCLQCLCFCFSFYFSMFDRQKTLKHKVLSLILELSDPSHGLHKSWQRVESFSDAFDTRFFDSLCSQIWCRPEDVVESSRKKTKKTDKFTFCYFCQTTVVFKHFAFAVLFVCADKTSRNRCWDVCSTCVQLTKIFQSQ